MNIIYFKPGTQYQNSGDALINRKAVMYYSQYGQVLVDVSALPKSYTDYITGSDSSIQCCLGGVSLYKAAILRSVKSEDKVWIALPPGDVSRKGLRAALVTLRLIAIFSLLKIFGIKFVRTGFSIGPFDRLNATLHGVWGRFFTIYGLRDKKSLELATDLGIKSARFFPDYALHNLILNPITNEAESIAISFRGGAYGSETGKDMVDKIVKWLRSSEGLKDKPIELFYQVDFDESLNRQVGANLSGDMSVVFNDKRVQPEEVVGFYSGKGLVISNRLHVLLYALRCGCTPVAVVSENSNRKIISLFRDIGLGEILFDVDAAGVTVEDLCRLKKQVRLWSRRETIKQVNEALGLVEMEWGIA